MKIDEKKMLEILAEMVKLLIDTIYEQEIVDCEMQGLIEKTEKEWKADYYEDYFIKAKNELKEERNETHRPVTRRDKREG